MITFDLHGELGNQMFQWATGLSFSINHEVPVSFCTLPGVSSRMSEFKAADKFDIFEKNKIHILRSLLSKLGKKLDFWDGVGNTQNEKGLNFQDLEFEESRNFHGYFQSWRYFHTIQHSIISEFVLVEPSVSFYQMKESLPSDFTGIHIRRGGSGAAILASDYHGLLDADYYKRAIQLNNQLGGSQEYIVFTDNPEKAQATINVIGLRDVRIIGPNDTHSQCENLLLMAHATSFIGANSSYSWWAAYLNTKLITQPIFPRQWYMDPDLSNNDMLLPDWISIGFDKFLNEEATRGINIG